MILEGKKWINCESYRTEMKIENALKENNELISIFVKSIETAQNNLNA